MKLLLVLILSLPLSSFGAVNARVKLVKGNVTKLLPGKMQANPVKKGDVLPEDTSIHTNAGSFVLLIFSDGTRMNIGPKSKLVVAKLRPKKASMVKLINGIMKAEVEKRAQTKPKVKLFVKTKTAVMGGFEGLSFRPHLMGKIAPHLSLLSRASGREKNDEKRLEEVKVLSDDVDELDKSFDEADDVIEVPEGKYSGVNPNVEKPVEPVKIAPQQYDALAKTMGSKKKAADVMKLDQAELKSKAGLRSGGYVDFNTGLYIPPPATAKIDKTTGTYKAPKLGKIDQRTGNFIPPKGVKVDPVKGLVVDRKALAKVASKAERIKLIKTVSAIKKEEAPLVVNKVEKKPKKKKKKSHGDGFPDDHVLSAKYIPYSEKLVVDDIQTGQTDSLQTDNADFFLLTWRQNWNKKWFTRLTMGDLTYNYGKVDGLQRYPGDDTGGYFAIGFGRHLNQKWTVSLDFVDRQLFYIVPGGPNNFESRSTSIGYMDLTFRYNLFNTNKMKFFANGSLYLMGEEKTPDKFGAEVEGESSGVRLELEGEWMWSKTLGIFPSLRYERMDAKTKNLEFTRSNLGLGLDFIWDV